MMKKTLIIIIIFIASGCSSKEEPIDKFISTNCKVNSHTINVLLSEKIEYSLVLSLLKNGVHKDDNSLPRGSITLNNEVLENLSNDSYEVWNKSDFSCDFKIIDEVDLNSFILEFKGTEYSKDIFIYSFSEPIYFKDNNVSVFYAFKKQYAGDIIYSDLLVFEKKEKQWKLKETLVSPDIN